MCWRHKRSTCGEATYDASSQSWAQRLISNYYRYAFKTRRVYSSVQSNSLMHRSTNGVASRRSGGQKYRSTIHHDSAVRAKGVPSVLACGAVVAVVVISLLLVCPFFFVFCFLFFGCWFCLFSCFAFLFWLGGGFCSFLLSCCCCLLRRCLLVWRSVSIVRSSCHILNVRILERRCASCWRIYRFQRFVGFCLCCSRFLGVVVVAASFPAPLFSGRILLIVLLLPVLLQLLLVVVSREILPLFPFKSVMGSW